MELDMMLERLRIECTRSQTSRTNILSAITNLLEWLNQPENNNDLNCKQVDNYIANKVIANRSYETLPSDIKNILFDMGGALNDTHTFPEIATNFESTPQQLLERLRNMY